MTATVLGISVLVAVSIGALTSTAAERNAAATDDRSSVFKRLDADNSLRLSMDEFLTLAGQTEVLRRDFRIFDFDHDEHLSKVEFAAVYGFVTQTRRGDIPDPFDTLVDEAMESIDQSYDFWDQRPTELVNSRQFVTNFMNSILPSGRFAPSGRILRQADPDFDNSVSRTDALQFLQQQLGVRWLAQRQSSQPEARGVLTRLRYPDGRVVNASLFLETDADRSGFISKREFQLRWPNKKQLERDFEANDQNLDGAISFIEFARRNSPNLLDPVAWFRAADKNLDALVDAEEMTSATEGPRLNLVASSLAGFDEDEDGKLSLQEYRLTMHANVNYPWDRLPSDENGDDRISFQEFEFSENELFQLQRRYYFHRLDRDRDELLSPSEFSFRSPGQSSLIMLSSDGKQERRLLSIDQGQLDSPDVSPDGDRVLLHRVPDEDLKQSRIITVDLADGRTREIVEGVHPSWSSDGRQFVCSRFTDEKWGVWIVDEDGADPHRIGDGSAPQWSPDGKTIAYLKGNSLWAYDVASEKHREVLSADDHSYQFIWWNSCWSPDSQRLILRGTSSQRRFEAFLVNMQGPANLKVRFSSDIEMGAGFVWSRDNRKVIFPMRNVAQQRTQLFEFDPDGQEYPEVATRFDRGLDPKTGCFSPDQRWYISVFQN